MQQSVVQAFGPGLNEDDERKPKTPSPAKQLRLDARRKDAALWTIPKKYPKATPFSTFAGACRRKDPSIRLNDAWHIMTPDERLPYVATLDTYVAQHRAEVQAFNARIPLSPLVNIDYACESDSDSDADDSFEYDQTLACRQNGGYGDCPEHAPAQDQRVNRRGAQLWNRYRRDHPGACGGAIVPVPEHPFRFLDLLPELRTVIYRLILYRPNRLVQLEPDQSGPGYIKEGEDDEMGPIDVRVFAVCKQIYEEATAIFFGYNLIKVELRGAEYLALPSPMFRTGFQPTNQDLISKLKRIEVNITTGKVCQWALKLVCRELANRSRLNEFRINAFGITTSGPEEDAATDTAIDEVYEILTVIRGVGCVIFNEPTWEDQASLQWSRNNRALRVLGSCAQRERVIRIMTTMD